MKNRAYTPLESDDANEFTEITRQLRAGTEIGFVHNDDGNSSALESYTKGHHILLNKNAQINRQNASIRTYKTSKSRQQEDIERPFGTERAAFERSALLSGQSNRNGNATIEETQSQGYKRPIASINNPGTVRIPVHTQNTLIPSQQQMDPQPLIPPATTNANAIIIAQKKRPSVKITGVQFQPVQQTSDKPLMP